MGFETEKVALDIGAKVCVRIFRSAPSHPMEQMPGDCLKVELRGAVVGILDVEFCCSCQGLTHEGELALSSPIYPLN